MYKKDVWPAIHAERESLVADLRGISQSQWSTTSLCSDWTVQDLLAHMTATAKTTPGNFFPKFVASGFSFTRMQAKDIAKEKGDSPGDTLDGFQSIVTSVKRPPGPPQTMLGETLIHSEDIRRPLGIQHNYPTDAALTTADFFKGSNLIIGAKRRIAGLSLKATDADWSHGSGPEVSGPIMGLLMAMTGRKTALDGLSGDGVESLRSRA